MKKRIFSIVVVLCVVIGIAFSVPTVNAAEIHKGIVEISTVSGNVGQEVIVPVLIKENPYPGIMAVTVSITYDPKALEYIGYKRGDVFKDYTVAAHPDRKLIRVVICEVRNRTNDGNMINLRFKVTKDAKAELSKIGLEYSKGDFCNWGLDKIMPEVVTGGVEVNFNGKNCPHKNYSEWNVISKPACEDVGISEKICDFCGHREYKEIKPIGHTYSDKWTVDKPATPESDGTMSRYCIRCDDYVDRITFSFEQSEKEGIDNTIWEDVTDNEIAEEIFKEQNPGKKPTQNKNPNKENSSSKDSTSSANNSESKTEESASSNKPAQSGQQNDKNDGSTDEDAIEEASKPKEMLEQLFPVIETDDGEKISVYQKLAETFPKFEKGIKTAQSLIIILLLIIFL